MKAPLCYQRQQLLTMGKADSVKREQAAVISWKCVMDTSTLKNRTTLDCLDLLFGPSTLCRNTQGRLEFLLKECTICQIFGAQSRQRSTLLQNSMQISRAWTSIQHLLWSKQDNPSPQKSSLCCKISTPKKGKAPSAFLTCHQKQVLLFWTLSSL